MIGAEKWTDNGRRRELDYDSERATMFGQDQDLETRQPWRPPVVPPSLLGMVKLQWAMMNRGLPIDGRSFDRAWEDAKTRWRELPKEFTDAWHDWYEGLGRNTKTEAEYTEYMKREPKWEEWNDAQTTGDNQADSNSDTGQ